MNLVNWYKIGLGTVVALMILMSMFGATNDAHAQAPAATNAEINNRWDRANTLYEQGDYDAALAEYLEVYKRKPLPVVRYNLGRAEEKLGHLVEALDWLEACLADPGSLDEERREYTQKLVNDLKSRIGILHVTTNVVGAMVEVDHREMGIAPQHIRVVSGVHIVSVSMPGYALGRKEVKIAGGIEERVHIDLSPAAIATARLTISSDVLDAEVFVDGTSVGKTPILGSIRVEAGEHKIAVRRGGYKSFERAVKFTEGDTIPLTVKLEEDTSWIGANGGYLQLDLSEEHVVVHVSGYSRGPYRGRLRLAPGKHHVRLERSGFATVEREVMVISGKTTREKVVFEANAETVVKLREEVATRRKWGIAMLGVGAGGIVASGIGLVVIGRMSESDRCGTTRKLPGCNDYPGWYGVTGTGLVLSAVAVGVGVSFLHAPQSERKMIRRNAIKLQIAPVITPASQIWSAQVTGVF